MPPERDDDHDEILRLRDRLHKLEGGQASHTWQIEDLREWRAEVRVQLQQSTDKLDGLLKADEVEEAVREAIRKERGFGLTFVQKVGASVVGAVLLADGIKGLVS